MRMRVRDHIELHLSSPISIGINRKTFLVFLKGCEDVGSDLTAAAPKISLKYPSLGLKIEPCLLQLFLQ